jgi:hypothetical protein
MNGILLINRLAMLCLLMVMQCRAATDCYRMSASRFNAYAKFIFSAESFSAAAQKELLEEIQDSLIQTADNQEASQAWVTQAKVIVYPPMLCEAAASGSVGLASGEMLYKKMFYTQVLEHYFIAVCEVTGLTITQQMACTLNARSIGQNECFDAAVRTHFGLGDDRFAEPAALYFLDKNQQLIRLFRNEASDFLRAVCADLNVLFSFDMPLVDMIDHFDRAARFYLALTRLPGSAVRGMLSVWLRQPLPENNNDLDGAMGGVYSELGQLGRL